MNTLPETILQQARSLTEGGVLSPKEFLHLGNRPAVDQAFSRLAKAGKLLRVSRGTYVAPVSSRFGSRAPAPEKVVKALAELSGDIVVPHGASAANVLGLTQQVPIREVYLTSGLTRKLQIGRFEVLMKHAPSWMLALGTRLAGTAVRALAWAGPAHVDKSIASLRRTLPRSEWQALASARAMLPGWMAKAIGKESAWLNQQQEVVEHDAWLHRQVQYGLSSANADRLVPTAEVEAKFAARRAAMRCRLEAPV